MIIHETGDPADPIIILLHPMEITGTEVYQMFRKYAGDRFLYIYPDQGGHGDDHSDYTDADREERVLADYLIEKGYTHIHLLFGASMGTTVALRLLRDTRFTFDHTHLDGTPLVNKAALVEKIMTNAFLHAHRACFKSEKRRKGNKTHQMYGQQWGDMMTANFVKLSETSLRNICKACCNYNCVPVPRGVSSNIVFEWGSKDFDYRLSWENRERYFADSKVILRKGYGHCGYMAAETEKYVEELMKEIHDAGDGG